jgi:hypothetical protein
MMLTRMVLPNRTPVPPREKTLIVPVLAVYIVREDRDHIFVCIRVHVVHLVAFVENIRHKLGRRCINDSRRNDIRHITVIFILGQVEAWV